MTLHFGTPQLIVAVVFAAITVALASMFLLVALSSRREVPFEHVQKTGYWIRKRWLIFLLSLLVLVVGVSMLELPFAGGANRKTVDVKVSASQFAWSLTKTNFAAGTHVIFHVTSTDVNHGMGIYDPGGILIAQVQAMPDYTNKLSVSLKKPGEYLISCLEYCGAGHHLMSSKLNVAGTAK